MKATITTIKNRFCLYLDTAQTELIIVERNGRDAAVLLSFWEFIRLQALEDAY
ncbi:Antitoxin [Gammaproteobacteria bacterium]